MSDPFGPTKRAVLKLQRLLKQQERRYSELQRELIESLYRGEISSTAYQFYLSHAREHIEHTEHRLDYLFRHLPPNAELMDGVLVLNPITHPLNLRARP